MIYVLRHCKATGQDFDAALTADGIKSATISTSIS